MASSPPPAIALLDHLAPLKDPRQGGKALYPLPEIMLPVLAATLAGADDSVEVTLWGKEQQDFLRRFYAYEHGIPSHDTLCDVFAAIDPDLFKTCFLSWVEGLRDGDPDIVAVDGKTSRGSHDRGRGRKPLHLVSAWAARQRMVLGQQATAEKSSEITAIPLLLKHLDLTGALVTIDAMGAQTTIAQVILEGGAHYCVALKDNRSATHAKVALLFNDPPEDVPIQTHTETDKTGGRIELRRATVCHRVGWMTSDRRYPGESVFPGLAMIGRIETEMTRNGEVYREARHYLFSDALDAKTFARAVRTRWSVENSLHWVLDVVVREDLARLRTGHGPHKMAIVRHVAVNLLSSATPTTSLKNRRKRAGWNTSYPEELIRRTA